jgi:hypothetical protein
LTIARLSLLSRKRIRIGESDVTREYSSLVCCLGCSYRASDGDRLIDDEEMTMRKSHHPAEPMRDPLGLAAHAPKPHNAAGPEHTEPQKDGDFVVNPLWMITAGLAAFLILLVAVW